jgi:hypothetical protein
MTVGGKLFLSHYHLKRVGLDIMQDLKFLLEPTATPSYISIKKKIG